MPIQWLKRIFKQEDSKQAQDTRVVAPARLAPAEPVSVNANAIDVLDSMVLDIAPRALLAEAMQKSLALADKTREADVFATQLLAASDRLALLERYAEKHGEPADDLDHSRQALEALALRGPLSSPPRPTRKNRNRQKATPAAAPATPGKLLTRPDIPVEFGLSPWLSSTRADDTGSRTDQFWEEFRRDAHAGEFWVDQIKRVRNDPRARLSIAMKMLPLPAAFSEAAAAVRSEIREAQKNKAPTHRQLDLLYWLAVVASFCVPYAERARQPGPNVMAVAAGAEIAALPFTYGTLGYARLELLTATDRSLLASAWGEPAEHTTLNALHSQQWEQYQEVLVRAHERRLKRLQDRI